MMHALTCLSKEQPNNLANLPKYAVQGRGATKLDSQAVYFPRKNRLAKLNVVTCVIRSTNLIRLIRGCGCGDVMYVAHEE